MTEISLEYGKMLDVKCTIHKELLCCYSTLARHRFDSAKQLHSNYTIANEMRKQLKAFTQPAMSFQFFEEHHTENKVGRDMATKSRRLQPITQPTP